MQPTTNFINKYISHLNAFRAAEDTETTFEEKPLRYYVYFLINPFNGKIFYVGKGKGRRKNSHLNDCRNGNICNPYKHNVISRIIKKGKEPLAVIFRNDLNEDEAYELEGEIIDKLIDYGLTNLEPGKIITADKSKESAKSYLDMILPFDEWCIIKTPNDKEKEYYWLVKNGLQKIYEEGNIIKIINVEANGQSTIRYEYS